MKFHPRWAATALFVVASGLSMLAHAASVSGQGTWETTLQARDLDGNTTTIEAYYDTSLNITWLADANRAGTAMNWGSANNWAAGLNINGYTGWRLPTVTDTGTPGCNFAYSGTDCGFNVNTSTGELAHMFYATLGDKAYYNTSGIGPQPGYSLTNTGPFSNLTTSIYWSSTVYPLDGPDYSSDYDYAWYFNTGDGSQYYDYMGITYTNGSTGQTLWPAQHNAWAVHSGDIGVAVATSTVPVPAAVWLLGSGLLGLIGAARRRKQAA